MKVLFVSLSIFLSLSVSQAAVWETTQTWTPEWEGKYREWVKANWHKDYFNQNGPLKGLVLDCADTLYLMRVIFSAQNGLPFAMKDSTTSRLKIVSNDMTRFDSQTADQRLRSFAKLVMGIGSTASVPADTYPTAISRDTLGSGSVLLTDKFNHHSWTVKHFSETGVPFLVYGSRPAKTTLFDQYHFPSVGFIFPNGIRAETNAGFRNFRYPADIGKPVADVPGYSLEQYALTGKWTRAVQNKMQLFEETNEQRGARVLASVCKAAQERVQIVADALKLNESIGSRCMDATEYDDNSTPNRDSRLKSGFEDLKDAFKEAGNGSRLSAQTKKDIQSVLSGSRSSANAAAFCAITIASGKKLTLGQVYEKSIGDLLSNNPHDTLEMRWGLAKGPSAKASSCPTY